MLTDGLVSKKESARFLNLVQNLKNVKAKQVNELNVEVLSKKIKKTSKKPSIF